MQKNGASQSERQQHHTSNYACLKSTSSQRMSAGEGNRNAGAKRAEWVVLTFQVEFSDSPMSKPSSRVSPSIYCTIDDDGYDRLHGYVGRCQTLSDSVRLCPPNRSA